MMTKGNPLRHSASGTFAWITRQSGMAVLIVILATTVSLVAGAIWGAYLRLRPDVEGFLIAMAGGALIVALMDEMIEPGSDWISLPLLVTAVVAGAAAFTLANTWVDARFSGAGGFGLLLAVTFDGVPENLALGTALTGDKLISVAALAASIFLSNLPEAAGGARRMSENDWSRPMIVAIWSAAAAFLALAALGGYGLAALAPDPVLATIKCFAAGAVVASLAIEIFPKAFAEERRHVGVAVALGLVIAYSLSKLG